MRQLLILLTLLTGACATTGQRAQEPGLRLGCETLEFNATSGHLNGLSPDASQARVNEVLPCATGASKDGVDYNHGGGVFFIKHDFYFYTGKDFIEVRSKFKGAVSNNLLNAKPEAFAERFGAPIPAAKAPKALLYSTSYGCLRAHFDGGSAVRVAAHLQSCKDVAQWYHR